MNWEDDYIVERMLFSGYHGGSLVNSSAQKISCEDNLFYFLNVDWSDIWCASKYVVCAWGSTCHCLLLTLACEEQFWQLLNYTVHNWKVENEAVDRPLNSKFQLLGVFFRQEWIRIVALQGAVDYDRAIYVAIWPQRSDEILSFLCKSFESINALLG